MNSILSTACAIGPDASPCEVQPGPRLSVVIPTFNERTNIEELVRRLDAALGGVCWEAIFVDDNSPDGTAEAIRALSQKDHRIRVVHRIEIGRAHV